MKVLAIVQNLFGFGGDSVNEKQLLKNLCKYAYKCIIISPIQISKIFKIRKYYTKTYEEIGKKYSKNVLIIPVPLPYVNILAIILSPLMAFIVWILDKLYHFDIVYVRDSLMAFGLSMFRSLTSKLCVKIPAIAEDEVIKGRFITRLIYTLTDRVALLNAKVIGFPTPILFKKLVLKRMSLPKGKIIYIPTGVDKEKIELIKQNINSKKLGKEYVIGFIGSIAWWQGVDILVKAVAKIKNLLDKPVKLLIVGDGPERRKIEALCKKLNAYCDITGFVKHEDALKLLKIFDVLVVPRRRISSTEAVIPIKIIEAWALGVPVIATAHEIFKYMNLRDGEDIVLCEPDPEDVANKILMILTDRELRLRLSERGWQLAKNYFYDEIVKNFLKVFDSVRKDDHV
ncbi:MAG: glycosyltransferase family 4 protein [Desulfurococcaceae archaeon]|nr:glycosyltransferase family 4 protein [Desulfurococcaceae archaeon]